jgi:hypothetical protein
MQLYPYVYIKPDGTARELHASERAYLETEFKGGDGAMPSIKDSYEERNGWGEIRAISNARRCRPACRSPMLPPKTRASR